MLGLDSSLFRTQDSFFRTQDSFFRTQDPGLRLLSKENSFKYLSVEAKLSLLGVARSTRAACCGTRVKCVLHQLYVLCFLHVPNDECGGGWGKCDHRMREEQNSVWHWLHGAFVSLCEPVWAQGPSTSSQE